MIEFVSYTGEYPNLCRGVLTLKIDGEVVKFGYSFLEEKSDFEPFWVSGGSCGFFNDFQESFVDCDEWKIDPADLPQQYRNYADEIRKVFNDNVEYGCCGGCL